MSYPERGLAVVDTAGTVVCCDPTTQRISVFLTNSQYPNNEVSSGTMLWVQQQVNSAVASVSM